MTTSKGALKIVIESDTVKLIGELVINTVSLFKDTIMNSGLKNKKLILDLSEITVMDSSGLGSLIRLSRESEEKIILKNIAPQAKNMIKVSECSELFEIKD